MPRDLNAYRRRMYVILTAIYVLEMFNRVSLGVVRVELEQTFALDAVTYGLLGGVYYNAQMLCLIPAGIIADCRDPKKTVLWGNTCTFAGTALFALSPNVPMLFFARFLVGVGVMLVFPSYLKIIGLWFNKREQATATGLATGLGYVCGIFALAPLSFLLEHTSWRLMFAVLAAILLLLTGLSRRYSASSPAQAGFSSVSGSDSDEVHTALTARQAMRAMGSMLMHRRTWPPIVVTFCVFGGYAALVGVWGTSYLADTYQISVTAASGTLTYTMVGTAISVFLMPVISQKLNSRRWPQFVCCVGLLCCWSILFFNRGGAIPLSQMPVVLFIMGLFNGPNTLSMLLIKELHPARYAGISTTLYSLGANLGGSLVPALVGVLYTRAGGGPEGYHSAFLACAAIMAVGAVCALMTETHCRGVTEDISGRAWD